jgi:hypothetical protein
LLPTWAQLLFLAARICPVSPEASLWFSRFTSCSGGDNARTILKHCGALRTSIQQHHEWILAEIQRSRKDDPPAQILAGWIYSLDTMILEARSKKTCQWTVEGAKDAPLHDMDQGGIRLKYV